MSDITLIKLNGIGHIDSRDVAKFFGKRHNDLLRSIRGLIKILDENEEGGEYEIVAEGGLRRFAQSSLFFIESSYRNEQKREMPCYLLTKMGCEVIANKLSGKRGALFTAAYVTMFNEMESANHAVVDSLTASQFGELNAAALSVIRTMYGLGVTPQQVNKAIIGIYQPLGLTIIDNGLVVSQGEASPTYSAKQIAERLGIYSGMGKPHAQAVSCILNENILVSSKHKSLVTTNFGNHAGVSIRYDEYAIQAILGWIAEANYPTEINGFERTFYIRYQA